MPPEAVEIFHYKLSKVATRSTLQPKLHFLDVYIHFSSTKVHTKALIDSGCAKTAISQRLYNSFPTKPHKKLKQISIQTCDGTTHGIDGIIDITITIGKRQRLTISMEVMIIKTLTDDFLLGLDFLSSKFVNKITPSHIHFQLSDETIEEEFITTTYPTMTIRLQQSFQMGPNEEKVIHTQIPGIHHLTQPFNILPHRHNILQITHFYDQNDTINTRLTNNSDTHVTLQPQTPLIQISKADYTDLEDIETRTNKPYVQPSITEYIEKSKHDNRSRPSYNSTTIYRLTIHRTFRPSTLYHQR